MSSSALLSHGYPASVVHQRGACQLAESSRDTLICKSGLPTACDLCLQVCHVRNIHGRSLVDIKAAARVLERIPALYPQLDASGLLQKDLPERKQACPLTLILLHSRTAYVDGVPLSRSTGVPDLYRDVLTSSI